MAALYSEKRDMNGNNEQVLSDKQQSVDDRIRSLRPHINVRGFGSFDSIESDSLFTPSPESKDTFGADFMRPSSSSNGRLPFTGDRRSSTATRRGNNKQQTTAKQQQQSFARNRRPTPQGMVKNIKAKFKRLPDLPEFLPVLDADVIQRLKDHGETQSSVSSNNRDAVRPTVAEKRPAQKRPLAEKRPAVAEKRPAVAEKRPIAVNAEHPTIAEKRPKVAEKRPVQSSAKTGKKEKKTKKTKKEEKEKSTKARVTKRREKRSNKDSGKSADAVAAEDNVSVSRNKNKPASRSRRSSSVSSTSSATKKRRSSKRSRSTPAEETRPTKRQRTEYDSSASSKSSPENNVAAPRRSNPPPELVVETNTVSIGMQPRALLSVRSVEFLENMDKVKRLKREADSNRSANVDLACKQYGWAVRCYLELAAFSRDMDPSYLESVLAFVKWTADYITNKSIYPKLGSLCHLVAGALGVVLFNKKVLDMRTQLHDCRNALDHAKSSRSTPSPQISPSSVHSSPQMLSADALPVRQLETVLSLTRLVSNPVDNIHSSRLNLPVEWQPTPLDEKAFGCTMTEMFEFVKEKFEEYRPPNQVELTS